MNQTWEVGNNQGLIAKLEKWDHLDIRAPQWQKKDKTCKLGQKTMCMTAGANFKTRKHKISELLTMVLL